MHFIMMEVQQTVTSQNGFSIIDFHNRWKHARLSALKPLLNEQNAQGENELVHVASQNLSSENQDLVLRKVFDHSRKLGISVSRYFNLFWEINDIAEILFHSDATCLQGHWINTKTGKILKRQGCSFGVPFFCNYWREALDGLVMGVGNTERYARHASLGHGDTECIDIFYDDSLDVNGLKPKFGELPEKIIFGLSPLIAFLEKQSIRLNLKGLSEGILYYELASYAEDGKPLCGSSNRSVQALFLKEVQTRFPGLIIKDASPLAVYGEGT